MFVKGLSCCTLMTLSTPLRVREVNRLTYLTGCDKEEEEKTPSHNLTNIFKITESKTKLD